MVETKSDFEGWCLEYYPETADELLRRSSDHMHYIDHSILKWEGLQPEALAKYGLELQMTDIMTKEGEEVMQISGANCALCLAVWPPTKGHNCVGCPLYQFRDDVPCYEDKQGTPDSLKSPWHVAMYKGNTAPMLAELKATKAWMEASTTSNNDTIT
jgi:hypothetical protein